MWNRTDENSRITPRNQLQHPTQWDIMVLTERAATLPVPGSPWKPCIPWGVAVWLVYKRCAAMSWTGPSLKRAQHAWILWVCVSHWPPAPRLCMCRHTVQAFVGRYFPFYWLVFLFSLWMYIKVWSDAEHNVWPCFFQTGTVFELFVFLNRSTVTTHGVKPDNNPVLLQDSL